MAQMFTIADRRPILNRCLAEFIGTFALVLFGCGAIVVNDVYNGAVTHLGISLSFGLVVMVMIYAVGNVSGAHFNPAVTLGFFFAKRFEGSSVLPYIGSQIAGAIAASGVLLYLFPEHGTLGSSLPHIGVGRTLVVEFILTFLLMFVILNVSTGHMEKGIMAGVAVGGTIAIEALVGGPMTGASMNPARSLGPALLSGNLDSLWIYFAAPILAAVAAHPFCKLVQGPDCCDEGEC